MKIILHIGAPKTGTTTLQRWLMTNSHLLEAHGIYLSRNFGLPNNIKLGTLFSDIYDQYHYDNGINTYEKKALITETLSKQFVAEFKLAAQNFDCAIISSEHFLYRLTTDKQVNQLADLVSKVTQDVEVICYWRNPMERLLSMYGTKVFSGETRTFNEFVYEHEQFNESYDYVASKFRWKSAFGSEKVNFLMFPDNPQENSFDVIESFGAFLPISAELIAKMPKPSFENKRRKRIKSAAMRGLNQGIPRDGKGNNYTRDNLMLKKSLDKIHHLDLGDFEFNEPLDPKIQNSFQNFCLENYTNAPDTKAKTELATEPRVGNSYNIEELEALFSATFRSLSCDLKGRIVHQADYELLLEIINHQKIRKYLTPKQQNQLEKWLALISKANPNFKTFNRDKSEDN